MRECRHSNGGKGLRCCQLGRPHRTAAQGCCLCKVREDVLVAVSHCLHRLVCLGGALRSPRRQWLYKAGAFLPARPLLLLLLVELPTPARLCC